MEAQLHPVPTLPTASPAAARALSLSLFWLQEYKGGRELWARRHLPSAGRAPAQLPAAPFRCPPFLGVFTEPSLGLPLHPCTPGEAIPAAGPYPSRQDSFLHASASSELTWERRGEPRGSPGAGSGPGGARGAAGAVAVPWKRRGAGARPGGSRWRRRTLAAPGAAPGAPGWPRAPPAPGSPAACGVGREVTAGSVTSRTHTAFGERGWECTPGWLRFAS